MNTLTNTMECNLSNQWSDEYNAIMNEYYDEMMASALYWTPAITDSSKEIRYKVAELLIHRDGWEIV